MRSTDVSESGENLFCRQVLRKPLLACPVKYEVYLTGVGGDESAQFQNNKI